MKKKTKTLLMVIALLLLVFILYLFENKGNKTTIVDDGMKFVLEFDKKQYKLGDKVKIKGYAMNITNSTHFYTSPDSCIKEVHISFASDIKELYDIKSGSTSMCTLGQAFTRFEVKSNEVIKVEYVLIPKGNKGDEALLKNIDLQVVATFDDINNDIEVKMAIPLKL